MSVRSVSQQRLPARWTELQAILLCALSVGLLLALWSYHPQDPGFFVQQTPWGATQNTLGPFGAFWADILFYLWGYLAYWLPLSAGYKAWRAYQRHQARVITSPPSESLLSWGYFQKVMGFLLTLIAGAGLMALFSNIPLLSTHPLFWVLPEGPGGLIGRLIQSTLQTHFNFWGTVLILSTGCLTGLTLSFSVSWFQFAHQCTDMLVYYGRRSGRLMFGLQKIWEYGPASASKALSVTSMPTKVRQRAVRVEIPRPSLDRIPAESPPIHRFRPDIPPIPKVAAEPMAHQRDHRDHRDVSSDLPHLDLLEPLPEAQQVGYSERELTDLSRLVEAKLADFGIAAQVMGVQPGPVIVRFELALAAGVKVSRITTLSKDLARALSLVSVRVVEVIPGKPYVGLEVPNTHREIVRLRALLEHTLYTEAQSPVSIVLGKDIAGELVIADLAKMPHVLVAGTTGSGKSVGVNAMVLSFLFKSTPEDLRLIMIDPKMLELSIYDGIPHLLTPVVTDMKDAANALKWCVAEMERRYRLMAALGVRHLSGYNRKIKEEIKKGSPLLDPLWPEEATAPAPVLTPLPHIVVIVDEFADMIMVVGRKVEELIARIAQKARAAGIHLILATQRPSVDVITGLIKANIPTRIAFQVSSRIDSRTILDQQGAEQLLGQGDMLYLPPGAGIPVRVHGAFVSDQEVHAVAEHWRRQQAPQYDDTILVSQNNIPGLPRLLTDEDDLDQAERDPLYDEAVQFILETRRASISVVQRRFKIGYNRAARIVDQMEKAGIVSAMQSSGGREILIPEGNVS